VLRLGSCAELGVYVVVGIVRETFDVVADDICILQGASM